MRVFPIKHRRRRIGPFPGERLSLVAVLLELLARPAPSSTQRWIGLTLLFLVPPQRSVRIALSTTGFAGVDHCRFRIGLCVLIRSKLFTSLSLSFWLEKIEAVRMLGLGQQSYGEWKERRTYLFVRSNTCWRRKKELFFDLRVLLETYTLLQTCALTDRCKRLRFFQDRVDVLLRAVN